MVDIDLLVKVLRKQGHTVGSVIPVPENAGEYEISVDGNILPLIEVRRMIDLDFEKEEAAAHAR